VGYAGRHHHTPLSHDAGLHLLEPLDRNGNRQTLDQSAVRASVTGRSDCMHNISYHFENCVFSNGPSCHCVSVSVRFVVFSAGLCSLAHGGVCGAGASAGNRVRIVSLI